MLPVIRSWLRDLNHFGRTFWYAFGTFAAVVGIRNLAFSDSPLGVTFAGITAVSGFVIVLNTRNGSYAEV